MARYRQRVFLVVALPLVLNALLYLAYRDWSLWCFRWVEWTGGEVQIGALRGWARGLSTPPEWVRFSLASGLWMFGVVSFLTLSWDSNLASGRKSLALWIASLLTICVGSEAFQALNWIPGTADWSDVCAYILGAALAVAFAKLRPLGTPARNGPPAALASSLLVAFAFCLATGAIYEGAMKELVAHVGLYK